MYNTLVVVLWKVWQMKEGRNNRGIEELIMIDF